MTELALNILDIANNATRANATLIQIAIVADSVADKLTIEIDDNGCGMDEAMVRRVTDPFSTTRTTRKVGMGIPLFQMAAQQAGGIFRIASELGKGTQVTATFQISHVDRQPLGDVAATVATLIGGAPQSEFVLRYRVNNKNYAFDTREVKQTLGESDLSDPFLLSYLQDMMRENIEKVNGGKYL